MSIPTQGGLAGCFLLTELDAACDAAVAAWFGDAKRLKVIHDAKPMLLAAASHGWTLAGLYRDTALAAYLARPDQRSYDLNDLALRYLHRELRVDLPEDGQLTLDGLGEASEELERNL